MATVVITAAASIVTAALTAWLAYRAAVRQLASQERVASGTTATAKDEIVFNAAEKVRQDLAKLVERQDKKIEQLEQRDLERERRDDEREREMASLRDDNFRLEQKVTDLESENRVKDAVVDQLKSDVKTLKDEAHRRKVVRDEGERG